MMHKQLMIGLEGTLLTEQERAWLKRWPPLGVILFARNIESPEQVTALLDDVRSCTGADTWAAIDEEGGRVNRIPWAPFNSRRHPAEYGERYLTDPEAAKRAVYEDNLVVGKALKALGFTHNCAPDLDLFHESGHAIIGKRAYSGDVEIVTALGEACMRGLSDAGIEGVGKHFPGHGRANADSHVAVPEVTASLDLLIREAQTFARLIEAGMKHVMSAHVICSEVENRVATLSPFWLQEVLRQRFGFDGKIWSDDLCMKGVGEDVLHAAREAREAGCDILLVCMPDGVADVYNSFDMGEVS
ncbi:beta-N-acetylhexosaminidase [Mariprofundus ferrinatatus]|uniref:beta-N-acetylhexosaminidase n=1 Tax=Mariprofundus ferrinatatus TaxID=1921087 RepID=A0A2K8L1H2_9PROT|nr:beta-N-acetylhexosaminidase [Mariprofundus ferrinatatus]ATX81165.1 beta-N-acetylhexosaminidase [Mariprofundus ferrinatatus]